MRLNSADVTVSCSKKGRPASLKARFRKKIGFNDCGSLDQRSIEYRNEATSRKLEEKERNKRNNAYRIPGEQVVL